jgi:hypothetical protein
MTNARYVLKEYEKLCSSLADKISAFGIIIFNRPGMQDRFGRELSYLRVRSKKILSAIEFVHNYQVLGEVHSLNHYKHRSLRPVIDMRPVYHYNRLQTDLYRYVGRERIHVLMGRSKQFKILKGFEELSLLPAELRDIVDLIEKKGITSSTRGYDSHVVALYFERTYSAENDYPCKYKSPQLEFTFGELTTYSETLGRLPTYFELTPFERHFISTRTRFTVNHVDYLLARQDFYNPDLRVVLNAIQFELI